jgi:hypothetical protein
MPKFIINIGEDFFPDKSIHEQIAKFHCIKFEGKIYEIQFFFEEHAFKFKYPRKKPRQAVCARGI